jgi:hypothetical protein
MAAEPLSCPYCNSYVTVAQPLAAGQKVSCPRCGEGFLVRPSTGILSPNGDGPGSLIPPAAPVAGFGASQLPQLAHPRPSNRFVAGTILGAMGLMTVVGLTFALLTVHLRREHDTARGQAQVGPEPSRPRAITPVRVVPPAQLAGLSYLPPDTQVVAAVHVAEALQQEAGQEWLRGNGRGETVVPFLESLLGLKLDDLDHLVFGLTFDEKLRRLTIVVQTRAPYDEATIRRKLQLSPAPVERLGKTLYQLPVEGVLWCAGERTLVIAIRLDRTKAGADLDQVPLQPRPGTNQLPAELQSVLKERMGATAQVWAAGHARDWDALLQEQANLTREDREALAGLRTFVAPLVFDDTVRVSAAFACRDQAAARALGKRLDQWGATEPRWKRAEQGTWVTVQTTTTPEAIRDAVRGVAGNPMQGRRR